IHELGHFLVAKASGIKIHEFALGMGPTILKKQKGETKYALRLFPIGGFVSMEGEDSASEDEGAFCKKPVHKKIAVVVAGAAMNIILGFLIMMTIVLMQPKIASKTIAKFDTGAVSSQTGLAVGDQIREINGLSILSGNDLSYAFYRDNDGTYDIQVKRDGKKVDLKDVKFDLRKTDSGQVTQVPVIDFKVNPEKKNVFTVLKYSALETASTARLVWLSLMDLLRGVAKVSDLSGPVGVGSAIGQASRMGIQSFLMLVGFITINIGVFNLLPLPALDGGRLIFLIIEGIRRKPIKAEYEGYIHMAGFIALMLLMVFVTFKDVFNIFAK
ncbi:MAG: rseP, partial [Oscillospiraceae bacterium]|nr:rseP [Oscillospiraceae bacterium]